MASYQEAFKDLGVMTDVRLYIQETISFAIKSGQTTTDTDATLDMESTSCLTDIDGP